ncbi:low-specificity L-threonine aldolase [Thalassotalea ponticola]|uniref:low-specificity L-threonine aldolase n=1 Tax=Thalassotalea ponticola TaxID=1523392 RepID=UPI0025B5F10F|nr:low-specificity L-threonine aldolase [Thalassotalea ponticola]MDN3652217.1 low-specificity L-threonine aldolase [Thalassotalea ponticola]
MIDFRSDTVTKPTEKMKRAMLEAELGDDVYGDDPSVNALEQRLAQMTGFDAAMIVNSGTQSNLCALLAHCQRQQEYITGQGYHTYLYEAGGAAVLGSVVPQPIAVAPSGELAISDIERVIKADDPHFAISKLISLENSHCGKVIDVAYFERVKQFAEQRGLSVHLDGARIFNAVIKLGVDIKDFCQHVDSISICFSKGLGTPMGSVLCGSKAFIQRARRIRKMVGGGTRQAGMVAAAMDYALDHHIERLQRDHDNAAKLAQLLAGVPGIDVQPVQTNMVYLDLAPSINPQLLGHLLHAEGILVSASNKLRLVTHLDISEADIIYSANAIKDCLALMQQANDAE